MQLIVNVVLGLIGGILLVCALLASVSLLFGIREFSWMNPLSWGILLDWNWDTTWKAAVIGLLIYIVSLLRRRRNNLVVVQIIEGNNRPRTDLNGLAFGAFDRQLDMGSAMYKLMRPERLSPYQLAQARNIDFGANPDLARSMVNHGLTQYLSASSQEALRKYRDN
ncbi:MAG TPA: hypothetical protein VK978_03660 [Candidatus Saccharimonadales bacterium]|nr:hypothetical protein [Candidatus Saccharimonadales bacterium]